MSLVMEYMPHGSLSGYLEKNASVGLGRMLLFASQICKVPMRHSVLRVCYHYVHHIFKGGIPLSLFLLTNVLIVSCFV